MATIEEKFNELYGIIYDLRRQLIELRGENTDLKLEMKRLEHDNAILRFGKQCISRYENDSIHYVNVDLINPPSTPLLRQESCFLEKDPDADICLSCGA